MAIAERPATYTVGNSGNGSESQGSFEILEIPGLTRIGRETVKFTYRTSKGITDPIPLLIAPGWIAPEDAYSGLGRAVARHKPSITFEDERNRGPLHDLNPIELLQVAKLSSKAAWAVMRYARDEYGHELFDVYGHSRGGQTAVDVTKHRPDLVRSIVLDESCGLDRHSFPNMLVRTLRVGVLELYPNLGKLAQSGEPKLGINTIRRIAVHPSRTLAEGVNAGSANLHTGIKQLTRRGIGAAAILSRNGVYFPLEGVERDSRHLFHVFHTRSDPNSNHFAPQLDPVGTADAVETVLDELLSRPHLSLVQ